MIKKIIVINVDNPLQLRMIQKLQQIALINTTNAANVNTKSLCNDHSFSVFDINLFNFYII